MNRARSSETGSAAAEITLITPAVILILLFVVAAGRLVSARQQVDSVARQAARAASSAPTPAAASQAATATARAALSRSRLPCRASEITSDTSAFRPGGHVAVAVDCSVPLADLTLLALPGTRAVSSRFSVPIDRFRGVTS